MVDPQVYLEKISLFSRMLRLKGMAVGPQETADACQILIHLGFEDRQRVKTALRTVFAKSREEQLTFDQVFDGFFISEDQMRIQARQRQEEEAQMAQARQEAERDLQFNGQPMELTEEQRDAYISMSDQQREKLRSFMDRYKDSAERNPMLYGNFIHSVFARAILEQQMLMENAATGCDGTDPEMGLLYRDISQFQDSEIPKAIAMIHAISQQINSELSAKRSRAAHSGALNFRKTIRKGLETGGSFYRLRYRQKRRRRKNLLILCDVSGSMVQFSEFALRFIQSLNQAADNSRIFLFSEELFEADAFHLQNMDRFRDYVRQSGVYGRGTDLGTALERLVKMQPAILNPSTTLLILSDTKTVDQPRAVNFLLEAKRLCGRILWLNPIPQSKWQYLRSVQVMSSLCPMVSCSTLRALASACKKLVE